MYGAEERLATRGAGRAAIIASAMELYVSHGKSPADAAVRLSEILNSAFADPNVSSLLVGATLLEDELVHGQPDICLSSDPVYLLSDEIIGMAIAELIGGTYARFEFTRYDQQKPGVLGELGPFLDDAVAGLIAGCTSRMYSECVQPQ